MNNGKRTDGSNRHRVAMTAPGIVAPGGVGTLSFWRSCLGGESATSVQQWETAYQFRAQIAARIDDAQLEEQEAALGVPGHHNRQHRMALVAALHALHNLGDPDGASIDAIVVGTAIGGYATAEEHYLDSAQPLTSHDIHFDGVGQYLRQHLGIFGELVTISTGCTSSLDAIGHAFWMVRRGLWKRVLVVSAESPLSPTTMAAFDVLGALTATSNAAPHRASRPFDATRSGFVLGEGAAAVVVEPLRNARESTQTPSAELLGFGSINSAYHMTDIEEGGAAISESIRAAADDAADGASALATVNYINAHGSSTPQNDRAEANAFRTIFQDRCPSIPVNSTKSLTGHALGTANLIELVHVLLQMQHCVVTRNINLDRVDPGISLCLPTDHVLNYPIRTALKTSSGFSGIHSALLLRDMEPVL